MLSSLKDDAILLMLEGFSEKGPKISICSIGFGKRNTICLVKLWQFLYQRKYRARLDEFRKKNHFIFKDYKRFNSENILWMSGSIRA